MTPFTLKLRLNDGQWGGLINIVVGHNVPAIVGRIKNVGDDHLVLVQEMDDLGNHLELVIPFTAILYVRANRQPMGRA